MSLYEAVFGREPPTLQDYLAGTSTISTVDVVLTERATLLSTLRENLKRAQVRMCNQENMGRTDVQFHPGDWVLLRLQPYRQSTLARRKSHKLARRFYGPFQILDRIGEVAYRLELPANVKIHNVFHVSKLKRFVGNPNTEIRTLPDEFLNQHPLREPEAILTSREILRHGKCFTEVLVHWKGQTTEDATWEDAEDFHITFPDFILEDKDKFQGGAIVAVPAVEKGLREHQQQAPMPRRSLRRNQGLVGSKFKDFVMNN